MKTVGEVTLKRGLFRIKASPHVMMKLKRVFSRVSQKLSELVITDTPEVRRDLEWCLTRYPLSCSRATRQAIRDGAREYDAQGELVRKIVLGGVEHAFELAVPARDYQKVAAELCYRSSEGGLLLADEMGVGKTASAIALMSMPGMTPALVATLAGRMPKQWEAEINRFAPNLRTHILKSSTPYDLGKIRRGKNGPEAWQPDVIITSYHKLSGWRNHFAGKIKLMVGDEIQKLKGENAMSRAWDHIAEGAKRRKGLSGTPIHNLGSEMYPVMERIAPGALGEKHEFLQEWCSAEDRRGRASLRDPAAFGTYLRDRGLMLRRTRKDVGRELPGGLTKVLHYVEWDEKKIDEIRRPAAELARLILSSDKLSRDERRDAGREFSMMLRQATGLAKAIETADFVKLAVESGERVLLYGWHHSVYKLWAERLKDYDPAWFTGAETDSQKNKGWERFMDGGTNILVMSLRAGAGLDGLQKVCKTVVFGELDWSPAVHEQCVTRVFRDGQTEPVFAYYILCDDGADPVMVDVLGGKRAQLEGVRDPLGGFLEELDTGGDHVKRLAESFLRKVEAA